MLHRGAKPRVGVTGGGGALHCPSVSHFHSKEKGGDGIIPSFLQIKLISGRGLLKEEILPSAAASPQQAFVIHGCPAVVLLLSKHRTFSLIFHLLAPNDALEALGLEGRWPGERSL